MRDILIVDDDSVLLSWGRRVIEARGYTCDGSEDANSARERLSTDAYKLVLLDVHMPGESGLRLLSHIRSCHVDVAVLMVTGEDSLDLATTAIEHGAFGYLVKPVGAGELVINVVNALYRRRRELEARHAILKLEDVVAERSQRLEQALQDLESSEGDVVASRAETIFRLARLVELRDEETGHHLQRMSAICAILCRRCGMPAQQTEMVRLASQLHDVGKVAIPDAILRKPGKLTSEEFEVIKGHTEAGHTMLTGSASEVIRMGGTIALTHHERWDGNGYPRGIAGEEIPLTGRIAALADVFDALTSDRVYRAALPTHSAMDVMRSERGAHFDPDLFDRFHDAMPEIERMRVTYAD